MRIRDATPSNPQKDWMDEVEWTRRYPSRDRVRAETRAMVDAFREVLLARMPSGEIAGLYFKGSARKRWDTIIDYVPETSDVDIHVLFETDDAAARLLGTPEQAFAICRDVETAFGAMIERPVHLPRPQLVILNDLLKDQDYCPSPRETVAVVYGRDYPEASGEQIALIPAVDRRGLTRDHEFLARFPLRVVDKPGLLIRDMLRQLSWRVGPTGPRALSALGVDPLEAWSGNRTRTVEALLALGKNDLAAAYLRFYVRSWDYFLSGYVDSAAGREAAGAGYAVIKLGAEIANSIGMPT